ncbi:hypothetical protein ACNHKD_11690 [Methylocystis sp. JAN1]
MHDDKKKTETAGNKGERLEQRAAAVLDHGISPAFYLSRSQDRHYVDLP